MFIACKAPSSVVPCSNMESSIGEASSSLLNLINARDFSALQQSKFGCFFKTLSASCNAFLLFPLSNQSKIQSLFRKFHTHTIWTVEFADFLLLATHFLFQAVQCAVANPFTTTFFEISRLFRALLPTHLTREVENVESAARAPANMLTECYVSCQHSMCQHTMISDSF